MLGHVLFSELKKNHQVWGTVRSQKWHPDLLTGYDVRDLLKVEKLISEIKPDFVINCVGIIKQLKVSNDKVKSIEQNALWPHRLAEICERYNSKMIQFSTDCVFSGNKGNYIESDLADARDTYGLSKYMGEVDYAHALTFRTSIIGHELNSCVALVEWFMSQKNECTGFDHAIYSGFPTIVIDRFINDVILENFINGIYHLSSDPINKFDLLKLITEKYEKKITITPSDKVQIDRSLNSDRLRSKLNWKPESWKTMISIMHEHYLSSGHYNLKK